MGLHHAAARLLFQDLGVYFTNMQLQCVFLEIDVARCGRLDEGACSSFGTTASECPDEL